MPKSRTSLARVASADKARGISAEQSQVVRAGKALGLGSGEGLVVKDVISDADGSSHVRYDRTFNGLRVIGGDLVSHRDKSGRIKGVSSNTARKIAVASTTPKLSLASAKADAAKKASLEQETTSTTKAELVLYAVGTSAKATPRLAYDVLSSGTQADQTPSRLHTIIDATSGGSLASWDEIETGTGNGIYAGSVPIGTTPGVSFSMRDPAGNDTTDLNGIGDGTGTDIGTLPGATFTDADDVWGDSATTDRASAGVDAHYGAEKTFDFYKNVLGRNGISNTGVGVRSRVHYGNGYTNAFWDGTQMTYGDGANNSRPLVELDIAGHEMTHGITQNTAALVDSGEAGGLNEATSDIFGTSVEWYANNASDIPDYLIGELANVNGDGTPVRYLDQPSKDGLSPDCWSAPVGGLDSHFSSGPLNHWFYLASEGSGAKVINGISYNSPTCNASTVVPIGRDQAAKIWYRALTTYLTSGSTYAAAREGAIQSAKDLYGATSSQCAGVAASFSAVGVLPGAQTCTAGPPPPAGTNLLTNSGFESGDILWSATANVIAQNGPDQPARSGTWNAWLGGYGATHSDSISQLVSIPASSSATLSYYVHIETNEAVGSPAHDTMTVRAGSSTLQTLSNINAASGYQLKTVNLSAYAGRTISLSFSGAEDASSATSFVLDDASVTTPPTVPTAPTAVTATAGNAAAVVSWTAPTSNGGAAITAYKVTAAPGGLSATTTGASTVTVPGLTNGTAYTFTVTATNAAGTSPTSLASSAVIPKTIPGAPTAVTATPGNATAVVSWTAPASNGGSAITGFTVRVFDATTSAQIGALRPAVAGATSLTVTGLVNGTAYMFRVLATNAVGSSPYSALSPTIILTAPVTRLSDYNRDGFTDLVARDSTGVLWLYPGNGAGRFQTRLTLGASGWNVMTALVTPGDVTGDGNADLLAKDAAGVLWLYPGTGASALGARRQIGTGWSTYTITNAGNFNGAGGPDLFARDAAGVLWLYPFSGNGVLGARTQVSTGWGAYTVTGPGDVSGDGRADILARDGAGALWIYPGNGIGGGLARILVSSGWQARTALVTPGNFDRLAGNDLITRDSTGALWFHPGNNAGGFGTPVMIGTSGWNAMTYLG